MNQIQNKYIILGSLCALLLTLVVGYAAFSTVLKIKGTSNINSNWDVRITDIQEGEKTGMASTSVYKEGDKLGQRIMEYEDLTATFSADLKSPGDSIEYNITVSNEGTLNAKLDKITISDPDNEYITFETSGLTEGMVLESKTSKILKVKVIFKDVTINKSEPSTSKLTVTLDFSQADGSGGNPEGPVIPEQQSVYSFSETKSIVNGMALEEIPAYTNDFNDTSSSVGHRNVILKHNIKDGVVESSDVCLKNNGELMCFKYGEIETLKNSFINYFGADACTTDIKLGFNCSNSYANVKIANDNNSFEIFSGEHSCSASSNEVICQNNEDVPL